MEAISKVEEEVVQIKVQMKQEELVERVELEEEEQEAVLLKMTEEVE